MLLEMAPPEPARFVRELHRARRGHWLAVHILLWLTLQRSPDEIAVFLWCARSTVYGVAREWPAGRRGWAERRDPPWPAGVSPALRRSLRALLQQTPRAAGWCRTRWSGATLALPWQVQWSIGISAETVRRCWHALDWVWKRAKLVAKDSDPERASKLARIRAVFERLGRREALLFADELDLHWLPKVGSQWMPRGTQVEVRTPGKNERRHLAGAWDLGTGPVHHGRWFRQRTGLFLDLFNVLERAYPARRLDRI
jgi:hypothetical protein